MVQKRFLQNPTPPLSGAHFRDVVGHFVSGVTVITVDLDGEAFGTTASAFSSLSLEPPMVVICLNRSSNTGAAVLSAGHFAVNVLDAGQEALAVHFGRKGDRKFAGVPVAADSWRDPLIEGALATFDCSVVEHMVGGTHRVFVAEVHRAAARQGDPLAYFQGRFGRLMP
jgi:flavin reductase (DIM6/NTAB) family NADH-FMN oxidoreductase RutF